jgi:hypothetical protein
MNYRLEEQDLYELLDKYRMRLKTSALTTFDIPKFIARNQSYEPAKVLKYIVLGNIGLPYFSLPVICNLTHNDTRT